MVELKLKCVTCSASFASDEIYSAHRQGHKKAEEWLRENLPKTKSTKRTPSPVKTVIEEPPPMSLIPHESQGIQSYSAYSTLLSVSTPPCG